MGDSFFTTAILGGHWLLLENRRKLFDQFAQEKGFDPLEPKNWYLVLREDVFNFKVHREG